MRPYTAKIFDDIDDLRKNWCASRGGKAGGNYHRKKVDHYNKKTYRSQLKARTQQEVLDWLKRE